MLVCSMHAATEGMIPMIKMRLVQWQYLFLILDACVCCKALVGILLFVVEYEGIGCRTCNVHDMPFSCA